MATSSPENSVRQFASVILSLEANRSEVERMSAECIKRQKEISWDANARKMLKVYERGRSFGNSSFGN